MRKLKLLAAIGAVILVAAQIVNEVVKFPWWPTNRPQPAAVAPNSPPNGVANDNQTPNPAPASASVEKEQPRIQFSLDASKP